MKEGLFVILSFSKELYPKSALLKAAYNFTDRAYVHLDASADHYTVTLHAKKNEADVSEDEFVNEMLCQSVRCSVYEQTKNIRELLTARAIASTVIIQPQLTDNISNHSFTGEKAQDILTDWFDKYDGTEAK